MYLVCRKIGLPSNVGSGKENHFETSFNLVRSDGYCAHMVELEIIERRGEQIFSKIIQKGSLKLNIGEEEDPRSRKGHIVKNFDATLGSFKHMNLMEICKRDKEKPVPSQVTRDEEVINLAVNDRNERVK